MREVFPTLAKEGVILVRPAAYTAAQKTYLEALFRSEIFPSMTPLRVENGGEFPFTGNLRLHAAFLLEQPRGGVRRLLMKEADGAAERLAVVQIPANLARVVWLPAEADGASRFTLLDDVVMTWGYRLFPGWNVKETNLFKVTRDADFSVDEEREEDFIEAMEEVLVGREQSRPVRLSVTADSPRLKGELIRRLALEDDDVYEMPGPIDLRSLFDLANAQGYDHLREEVWKNYWPADLPVDEPLWDRIGASDVLLQLPYESFDPVVRFVADAATDPQTLAIKMTLYRTSGDSPIVKALETAAQNGKQVTVLVELKARFDEGRNIAWASRLEQSGVIVVYGIARLKVHAKACLVVRRETDGVRRYLQLSTGNYNDRTARVYGDFVLFTANSDLTYEASLFFNMITGYSAVQSMRSLIIAPTELKHRVLSLIERETKRATQEFGGTIIAKMNSLADVEVIDALYRASRAGVKILLNVRGICMLVPGVVGLSDNIRVVSVVDRYLEHARAFYFANGGAEEVYLSSADWMSRNLERRIELMFPVLQEDLKRRVVDTLSMYFLDNDRARELGPDGVWRRIEPKPGEERFRIQERIHRGIAERAEIVQRAPRGEFVVRRRCVK
jgi:polyphosphate kinase